MPARNCRHCDLRFPVTQEYVTCPKCEEATAWQPYLNLPPDWKERLNAEMGMKTEFDEYCRAGYVMEEAWDILADKLPIPPSLEVFDFALTVQNDREMYDIHPVQMAHEWAERTKWEFSGD